MVFDLRQIQQENKTWVENNFPGQKQHQPLLGIAEEVGELCHAHLKGEQNIRHEPHEIHDMKVDAVGDIFIYLMNYCNVEGINLEYAIKKTWHEVKQRDWREDK